MSAFSHLAEPLEGPRLRLKNRVAHPAILTLLVQNQEVSDAFLRYHANRAQGGAAMLVLEPLDAALARGVRPIAEVVAYAETFDAHSMMSLAPEGPQIERMLTEALDEASLDASAVGLVNAHGTGTELNDVVEAAVIGRVFGPRVAVTATKSLLGHTIGASGALEAVATAFSLRDQTTHACRNLDEPIADLAFVREVGALEMEHAVSQSFAFGGHNACLVMRRA